MDAIEDSILWHRVDRPGSESSRLSRVDSSWVLAGTAVFAHEERPVRLDYEVVCDAAFRTELARVSGWLGRKPIEISIRAENGRWSLDGEECADVEGAVDLDLNFSPSTNLLPIRRLGLSEGASASVRAAWLRFPRLDLAPLQQSYHRIGPSTYRYESATGFTADLEVRPSGLVRRYPGVWEPDASS